MNQLRANAPLITCLAIAMTIVSLAFGAAGATSALPSKHACAGGASSVTAWVDANGTVHQSAPVTTGCIP